MLDVAAHDLHAWLRDPSRTKPLLLDVREPWEYALCRIDGSLNVPMRELPNEMGELPRDRETVVICHHGVRSAMAARFLEHAGFGSIFNLQGGVSAWADDVDPAMPRY
jgi:rhodanese-related sulfurtransferase